MKKSNYFNHIFYLICKNINIIPLTLVSTQDRTKHQLFKANRNTSCKKFRKKSPIQNHSDDPLFPIRTNCLNELQSLTVE